MFLRGYIVKQIVNIWYIEDNGAIRHGIWEYPCQGEAVTNKSPFLKICDNIRAYVEY